MKLLVFLILSLFNQDNVLVEQGQVNVTLSDLDAYVHNLPPKSRYGFIEDPIQVEKNILTLLNMNFVYQYINDTGLIDKQEFSSATQALDTVDFEVEDAFANKLGINKADFLNVLKLYTLKKEYFMRLNIYFKQQLLKGTVQSLAYDQFISQKKSLKKDEKRRLSVIQLSKENHTQENSISILNAIIEGENFNDMALEVSDDPSVNLNKGDLSFYTQKQFKYKFSKDVFAVNDLGVIPTIFETKEDYYLISINEITPEKEANFDDYKQKIVDEILPGIAKQKMQNVINEYSNKSQINVNKDNMNNVFKRYLVFEEDQ